MIDIVTFYNTVVQTGKLGTSGFLSQDEVNANINYAQRAAFGTLSPFFAINQQVQDLLGPFVKTASFGAKPGDYAHFVAATQNGKESYPINPDMVDIIQSSPIRSPAESGNYYHYFEGDVVRSVGGGSGSMIYLGFPPDAEVVLTPVAEEDDDYLVASSGADLLWPMTAFNLLLYYTLLKMGIEVREPLLGEFARFGIETESIKPQIQ